MMGRVLEWLDREIGVAGLSEMDRALARQRFTGLKKQLPWLYGMLFSCLFGIHIALTAFVEMPRTPVAIALLILGSRIIYWVRASARDETDAVIAQQMRNVVFVTVIFCLVSLVWSVSLYREFSAQPRILIATFASMVAIGCCYGMNSFPAAARIPVLVLALPISVILMFSSEVAHVGMGSSFVVLSLLSLRLLRAQDRLFRKLVMSRFAIDSERRRALEAEQVAIAEQVRVGIIADTDPLTKLANRRGFLKALDRTSAARGEGFALILLDLDGFKPVNDTFGHAAGDAMLVEVSRRLKALPLDAPSIARLGGDEFALLVRCDDGQAAAALASEVVAKVSESFYVESRNAVISCCAGVSFQPAERLGDAMCRADLALYAAKRKSRGSVALFSANMQEEVERRTSLEQALRDPGLLRSIDLAFQPIFDLRSMKLKSFEALARWRHSELGWIPPSEFIPISEQLNLIHDISEALLKRAVAVAQRWPNHVQLSFNFSALQLSSPDLAARVLDALAEQGVDPRRLQVEVTETALMSDFELARENLSQLRRQGVRIVLDDFGAGYSSISYLREMWFDAVKLDGSLVSSATQTRTGLPLLRGVLALCRAMGQECVAEHIEHEYQRALLLQLGCEYGQGYLLSEPISAAEATRLALGLDLAVA